MPDRPRHKAIPRRPRSRPLGLSIAVALAVCGSAQAARLDYRLELAGLHSDNLNLSEDNQANEKVLIPKVAFTFTEEGSALRIQARGQVERRMYSGDHQYDNETRSEFAGQLNWSMLPERLNLVLEDYLTEEPINFRDGRYPGNLQRVNIFVGGPTFLARFNDATRLKVDVRAADTYAEVSPGFDSKRYAAAAALQRDIKPTAKISLNVTSTRVEFDSPATVPDYTRYDAFVRYEGTLRRARYELDAGDTHLQRKDAHNASMAIARATFEWDVSPRSRLRLRARHQFADEVRGIIVRLGDPDEPLVPDLVSASDSLVTGGVYRQRSIEADYRFTGDRFGFRFRPQYRTLRYLERADANRTEKGAYFQATYRLAPRLNAFLDGQIRKRVFDSRDEQDLDHVYGLGLDYQMTRHLGWRAEYFRNKRDSNLFDPTYTENAVQFSVWWKR